MNTLKVVRHAALGLAVVAAACTGADVAAPRSPESLASVPAPAGIGATQSADYSHPVHPVHPVHCDTHAPVKGSGTFGPQGGVLVVGSTRLYIPGGALHRTVVITGTALGDGSSTVEFQPHGLHFDRPAFLALNGAGCAFGEGAPSIVYLDGAGNVLETIAARYLPRWKTVGAPINHFSGYAIAF